MRQDAGVKAFKNELANYRFYKDTASKLQSKIENCYSMLPGAVKGNDPSRTPIHGAPNKDFEYKMRDEIERYERDLTRLNVKIRYIEEILAKIETPLKTAIISKYVNGKTLEKVATTMFITPMGLLKQINKAIKKALDD